MSADLRSVADRLETRPARWSDLAEVRAVYLAQDDADRQFYHPFPFGRWRLGLMLDALVLAQGAMRRWVHVLPRQTGLLYVARAGRDAPLAAIGTVRFRRDADGRLAAETGYYVVPALRRRHVGTRFKSALIDEASRLGARRVFALIHPDNTASIELNRRLGFEVRAATPEDRVGAGQAWLVAVKELGPPGTPSPADRSPVAGPADRTRV